YESMFWMAEVEEIAKASIRDFTGLPSAGTPPLRAGDMSFANLGVSTFFMLASYMSKETLARLGYYGVGGCAGHIEWHTEADTLAIADRDVLLRDMGLYAGAVFRTANLPLHPLDFRATVRQLEQTLAAYAKEFAGLVEFDSTFELAAALRDDLERLYTVASKITSMGDARPFND